MAVSTDLFKQGMRMLGGGVTIVTTESAGVTAGLTATAVCSLSAEPQRLLACINRNGATYGLISASRNFCVNVLAADHQDLAACFAGIGSNGTIASPQDRFQNGKWARDVTGAPVLEDALVSFDCRVLTIVDTGSHAIIIGDIHGIRVQPGAEPLLYMEGRFSTLRSLSTV
jgi:flavin reductase (DIM6/NTAB) family NADH-FMN oxidoreductase RutF